MSESNEKDSPAIAIKKDKYVSGSPVSLYLKQQALIRSIEAYIPEFQAYHGKKKTSNRYCKEMLASLVSCIQTDISDFLLTSHYLLYEFCGIEPVVYRLAYSKKMKRLAAEYAAHANPETWQKATERFQNERKRKKETGMYSSVDAFVKGETDIPYKKPKTPNASSWSQVDYFFRHNPGFLTEE